MISWREPSGARTSPRPRPPPRPGRARHDPPLLAAGDGRRCSPTRRASAAWLEVELLAVEAWATLGVIPAADAAVVRARAPKVDAELVAEVAERERVTDHDVAAFVDVVQDGRRSPRGGLGPLRADLVGRRGHGVVGHPVARRRPAHRGRRRPDLGAADPGARAHRHPHGRAAPTACTPSRPPSAPSWPCGACRPTVTASGCARRAGGWRWGSCPERWGRTRTSTPGSRTSCAGLSASKPVPATQVIARDRHAEYLWACAAVGATVETIGTEIRHLARTEVGEAEERFGAGQKGSSSMPHKRNPILSRALERSGPGAARLPGRRAGGRGALARARHLAQLGGADHPPRRLLPHLLRAAQVRRARRGPRGQRRHGCWPTSSSARYGLVFSQPVLLALVESGMTRDDAYRVVQRDARRAWEEDRDFRAVLEDRPRSARSTPPPSTGPSTSSGPCATSTASPTRWKTSSDHHQKGPHMALTLVHSGKVRELYDAGDDRLLMVASDRISAFDVVMAEPIPDKGRVLTAMTVYWLDALSDLAPSHLVSADPADFPSGASTLDDGGDPWRAGRMLVRRAEMLPIECIVRGYLAGSAWDEYKRSGHARDRAPPRPAPVRPAARAGVHPVDQGHRGPRREHLLRAGGRARRHARRRPRPGTCAWRPTAGPPPSPRRTGSSSPTPSSSSASSTGELALCDEVLTPDSSRFWPADQWEPGTEPALVRQAAAARLARGTGWDKTPPPPRSPRRDRHGDQRALHRRLRAGAAAGVWPTGPGTRRRR